MVSTLLTAAVAVATFASALMVLITILSKLTDILNNITQAAERATQTMSIWERWRLGFTQFIEGVVAGEQAWNRFVNIFSRFGITMDELTQSLSNAIGDISQMAAQGRIVLEDWASLLGEIGRLGIRAEQVPQALRAALEGRIAEAGGLGAPIETIETIAMLQYGIAGMGETAARAAVTMEVLRAQIEYMGQYTSRAGQAIYAYNQIVGQLQSIFEQIGRIFLEYLAEPLQRLADILRQSEIAEAARVIAEGLGVFASAFLNAFAPFLEEIAIMIVDRAEDIKEAAQIIGRLLGESLGVALKGIVDFLTQPMTLAAFIGFAALLRGITELVSGLVRFFGPPLLLLLGAISTIAGVAGGVLGFIFNKFMDFINWIAGIGGRLVGRGEPREQRMTPQQRVEDELTRAIKDLTRALQDTTQATIFAKRALEAVSEESRNVADMYRRSQEAIMSLAAFFTPMGFGAMWVPFEEYFRIPYPLERIFRQSPIGGQPGMGREAGPALERIFGAGMGLVQGVNLRERIGIGLMQTVVSREQAVQPQGLEEAFRRLGGGPGLLEFRIPVFEPIPMTAVGFLAAGLGAALREVDARMASIASFAATLNKEMERIGWTVKMNILEEFRKWAEALVNVAKRTEEIRRQMEEMVKPLRQAYELSDAWFRLHWGVTDLEQARTLLQDISGVEERILWLTQRRMDAQQVELNRAAQFLAILTAQWRLYAEQMRRRGLLPPGIEPEEIDLLRMTPVEIAALGERMRLPYPIIAQAIQAQQQFLEAQRRVFEEMDKGGEEILSVANAFRSLQTEIANTSAKFGDFLGVAIAADRWARSFQATIEGLAMRAAAALLAGRWNEYIDTIRNAWTIFASYFQQSIDLLNRSIEALGFPLNTFLDRLQRITNVFSHFGMQALLLPQIFNQALPAALQYLRTLEQMAAQYREHPYHLNAILQAWEQTVSKIMGLIGQAGTIVPAIPLSELTRIAQMPVLAVREVMGMTERGAPGAFAPVPQLMGVPPTLEYLYGLSISPTVLGQRGLAELVNLTRRMGALGAGISPEEIQRQGLEELRHFFLDPMMRLRMGIAGYMEMGRERLRRALRAYYGAIPPALEGLLAEGVPLPGIEGLPGFRPEIPTAARIPQEVPVRLRVELENNTLTLNIMVKKPEGGYEIVPAKLQITPITPPDVARRNPPTTGF